MFPHLTPGVTPKTWTKARAKAWFLREFGLYFRISSFDGKWTFTVVPRMDGLAWFPENGPESFAEMASPSALGLKSYGPWDFRDAIPGLSRADREADDARRFHERMIREAEAGELARRRAGLDSY